MRLRIESNRSLLVLVRLIARYCDWPSVAFYRWQWITRKQKIFFSVPRNQPYYVFLLIRLFAHLWTSPSLETLNNHYIWLRKKCYFIWSLYIAGWICPYIMKTSNTTSRIVPDDNKNGPASCSNRSCKDKPGHEFVTFPISCGGWRELSWKRGAGRARSWEFV